MCTTWHLMDTGTVAEEASKRTLLVFQTCSRLTCRMMVNMISFLTDWLFYFTMLSQWLLLAIYESIPLVVVFLKVFRAWVPVLWGYIRKLPFWSFLVFLLSSDSVILLTLSEGDCFPLRFPGEMEDRPHLLKMISSTN